MRNKKLSFWLGYTLLTMLVLFISFILVGLLSQLMIDNNLLPENEDTPMFAVLLILALSAIFSLIFFLIAGRIVSRPFIAFKDAFKIVSQGNLDYRLNESMRINELEEVRGAFNAMVSEISSIETLRSDFVANVSHEFKTPLSAIEGYATLLQDESLPKETREEYIRMIQTSARELSTLTGNILDLSKLENSDLVLETSKFRLDEQIRELLVMLEEKWTSKGLDLDLDLDRVSVVSNKSLLAQVWKNLIDNAIKYSDDGGKLIISLEETTTNIRVRIEDTGIGMSKEELTHIFDKFYQVDHSRKTSGNGLGLALVKRIVDLIKGEIIVNSIKGKGTTIEVILNK